MYPSFSDYLSEEPLNFDRLRHEIVSGVAYAPAVGMHEDLQQHFDMLEREFAGQSCLKLVHARLIVLIRRERETATVYEHFCRLWDEHAEFLAETLNTRWLVSACDTICDHSADQAEVRVAAMCSLFSNTLKLFETERLLSAAPPPNLGRRVGGVPIFDGMTAFAAGRGNMVANLLARVDGAFQTDTRTGMIGRELVTRALSSDTVFARPARMQAQNRWRAYLPPSQAYLPSAPNPARPASADNGRHGYILLNDTGRLGRGYHMGTVAACTAIRQSLGQRGLTEIGWANDGAGFDNVLAQAARKPALVVLNGEGTLHHSAPRAVELLEICTRAKDMGLRVAVVNTVWERNSDAMAATLATADAVHVRDSLSRAALPADSLAQVTPDVSIHLFLQALCGAKSAPVHDLAVMDSVVPAISDALLRFAEQEILPMFAMPLGNLRKMRQDVAARSGPVWPRVLQLPDVLTSRAWVTGRFHGLIAALCAGRPVCALPSNTAKVEGFLLDTGLAEACLLEKGWINLPVADQRNVLAQRFDMQRTEAFLQRRQDALTVSAERIGAMFDTVAALAK